MSDLGSLLEQYKYCDMFDSNEFPNDTNKIASIPKIFHDFANGRVNPYLCSYALDLIKGRLPEGLCDKDFGNDAIQVLLRTNTLKRDMRCDMWGICLDQVWLEFLGVPTSRTRPVPFVESVPLTLWICQSNIIPEGVVLPSNSSSSVSHSQDNDPGAERSNRKNRKLLKQYYSEDSTCSEDSSPNESTGDARLSNSTSSNSCDMKKPDVQYNSLQIADFNVVAKIGGKIRAQLSNPQYLFLMRLIESVTKLQTQVNADIDDFFKGVNKSSTMTFSFPLVIPEIEFAMVCPYIAELLPLTNPVDIIPSPTPEMSEGKDVYGEVLDEIPEGQQVTNSYTYQEYGYNEPPQTVIAGKIFHLDVCVFLNYFMDRNDLSFESISSSFTCC